MIPALIGAGAGLLGGVMSGIGQHQTNVANARMAREQMNFQREMSNTSWQRAVTDIKAAGLNPALAYGQGGATSPAGQTATMQNTAGNAINSAAAVAQSVANIELTKAQAAKVNAEADIIRSGRQTTLAKLTSEATSAQHAAQLAGLMSEPTWREKWLDVDFKHQTFAMRVEQIKRALDLIRSRANETDSRAAKQWLEVPTLYNKAQAEKTAWKRYVTPYLGDAHTIARTLNPFTR